MTSNLGSDRIQELMQDEAASYSAYDSVKAAVLQVVSKHFRPEFINRIDELVVFHPLQKEHIRDIANIQIDLLRQRLQELDLQLQLDPEVLDKLSKLGFDPLYGARPLKRAIQQWLENPLAQEVLKGNYPPGSIIKVKIIGVDLAFS
jgi:ATP-dependent Clp protease ATP-binding subunit ClpB